MPVESLEVTFEDRALKKTVDVECSVQLVAVLVPGATSEKEKLPQEQLPAHLSRQADSVSLKKNWGGLVRLTSMVAPANAMKEKSEVELAMLAFVVQDPSSAGSRPHPCNQ